jgi:hypothetical protein
VGRRAGFDKQIYESGTSHKVPEWVSRIDQEDRNAPADRQDGYKDSGCSHASKPEKTRNAREQTQAKATIGVQRKAAADHCAGDEGGKLKCIAVSGFRNSAENSKQPTTGQN